MTAHLPTPWDPDINYRIERSETPKRDDGYKRGEPKFLVCESCTESVLLTEVPTAGVDQFPHAPHCPQRFARSEWFQETHDRLLMDT